MAAERIHSIGTQRHWRKAKQRIWEIFIYTMIHLKWTNSAVYEDDKELYRRLLDDKATWQMAISMVLPARDDIAKVTQGWYALRKRSGFINEADHVVKTR